jgi:hypothetical protein
MAGSHTMRPLCLGLSLSIVRFIVQVSVLQSFSWLSISPLCAHHLVSFHPSFRGHMASCCLCQYELSCPSLCVDAGCHIPCTP